MSTRLVGGWIVIGALQGGAYGLLFALLAAKRAVSTGAGLIWGLGYAFVLWLALPAGVIPVAIGDMPSIGMLDTARAHFPELVAHIVLLGVPLGVTLGTLGGLRPVPGRAPFSLSRALMVGGLSGVMGGWVFGQLVETPSHR